MASFFFGGGVATVGAQDVQARWASHVDRYWWRRQWRYSRCVLECRLSDVREVWH